MFLSDTEELVQEKVLCSFCGFAIMVHSSVSDNSLLSGHPFTPYNACMCQCRRLGRPSQELLWEAEKRILPYTLQVLPGRASHTGSVCGHVCIYMYPGTHVGCHRHSTTSTTPAHRAALQGSHWQAHTGRMPGILCNLQVCTSNQELSLRSNLP